MVTTQINSGVGCAEGFVQRRNPPPVLSRIPSKHGGPVAFRDVKTSARVTLVYFMDTVNGFFPDTIRC